ncbi:surfeit locus protein 6 homolog [Athalia rosae]|uniref:surfeit locus protein 6 homolog n=1 Tax=Athalia rosae TaxID=37344 RepID=UPI0020346B00|nr:surfeit locus protein 6 homolog [Athalia rosae]
MQLTNGNKAKALDVKLVKQILLKENKYITELFSRMPVPVSAQQRNDEIDDEEDDKAQGNINNDEFLAAMGTGTSRASTLIELHQKLEHLKGKRLDYKEKLMRKGLKNRLKKKSKKEQRLMQKKLAKTELAAAGGTKAKHENGEMPKFTKPKPIFNSEGKMVFSKFDFSAIGAKKVQPKEDKDPKKLLLKLEKQKQKINDLEQAGKKDVADELKEKQAWKTVLAKASGEKIRDNPELLKKSVKKEEQKKKRSLKKWDSRLEGVQKALNEKQQKRQENIQKRKKEKKVNKLKKAAKRGRIIPGF